MSWEFSFHTGFDAKICDNSKTFGYNSPISRVIGNFFLGLNRPLFPVKLFTEKNEASKWLANKIPKTN
ncbi:MAG: hypothetical protein OEZ36_13750 [Spirochaetota bacterium]|nr:hypothetical protein [Spirochaetota bacterium]